MTAKRHIVSKRNQYRCGWRFSHIDGKRIITVDLLGSAKEVKVLDDDETDYYVEELEENE